MGIPRLSPTRVGGWSILEVQWGRCRAGRTGAGPRMVQSIPAASALLCSGSFPWECTCSCAEIRQPEPWDPLQQEQTNSPQLHRTPCEPLLVFCVCQTLLEPQHEDSDGITPPATSQLRISTGPGAGWCENVKIHLLEQSFSSTAEFPAQFPVSHQWVLPGRVEENSACTVVNSVCSAGLLACHHHRDHPFPSQKMVHMETTQ